MSTEQEMKPNNLKSIMGVEIFSSGVWNGDEYTERDMDEMVRAFNETSKGLPPPLKLGHDDNQNILQNDGYPAAGWIGRLYRSGQKLLADFIDIPEKIYELLKRGAYKKVSSEIYWNADVNGQKYDRMLAGVALLGADIPAVSNLSDILAMYGFKMAEKKAYAESKSVPTIKIYQFPGGQKRMTQEQELKEVELQKQKLIELEAQLNAFRSSQNEQTREYETLKKNKLDSDRRVAELERVLKEQQIESQVDGLVSSQVISPSMRLLAKELLGEEKKLYTVNKKDLTRFELLKEFLSLHSEALKLNKKESSLSLEERRSHEQKEIEALEKYAKEHNLSHKEAYKAMYRGKLKNVNE